MITISFWGNLPSKEPFAQELYDALGEMVVSKSFKGENVYYLLKDGTTITMGVPESASTHEKFNEQVTALQNYIMKVPTEKVKVRKGVIEQLESYNIMLGIAFDDTGDKSRLDHILASILIASGNLKGVVLLSNMDMLDGKGNMLFSYEGKSDYEDFLPQMFAQNVCSGDFKPSIEDQRRFELSNTKLKQKGITLTTDTAEYHLKKAECCLKPVDEIAKRILGLLEVCTYSKCMLNPALGKEKAFEEIGILNDQFKSTRYVSMDELTYLNTTEFDEKVGEVFVWRYESLALLCWSLGILKTIDEPLEIIDSQEITSLIKEFNSIEKMIVDTNLRPIDELLVLHDITMRYYLACKEAKKIKRKVNIDEGIVTERYLALTWLLTNKYGGDWDKIEEMI